MDDDAFADCLSAAQEGDEPAFATIWRAHHPAVRRYLTVVLGADTAEDVASEVWLDVARSLHRFRGSQDGFRGWLFTIARRRGVDARRAMGRRPSVVDLDAVRTLPTTERGPYELTELAWSTSDALNLIAALPADQAEIVALRVLGDLDVATVASLVDKSQGAVRVASHRALRSLASRLEQERL